MNEWSRSRRRNALIIVLAVLIVLVAVPLYFFLQVKPTCFDGKQNGDETGVDCGGSCTTLCTSESLPLVLKGDPQVLAVSTSTYEVVAYVQNPNPTGVVLHAPYTLNLYEASSAVPVQTITQSTYVPKGATFALFEGPFDLAGRRPTRATLSWDQNLTWVKDLSPAPNIDVSTDGVTSASSSPRLDASVKNDSLGPYTNIELVALVFDDTGTIAAASKTYVDSLDAGQSAPVTFTWPTAFSFLPASVTIIPVVLPDASYVR